MTDKRKRVRRPKQPFALLNTTPEKLAKELLKRRNG